MRSIYKNIIFQNLVINVFLVIFSYGLASLTGLASNAVFQPLKVAFLVYSMIKLYGKYNYDSVLKKTYIFSALIIFSCFFSVNPVASLKRATTLIFPLIYIGVSLKVLFNKYPYKTILDAIIVSIRWIYLIPSLSFFLFGGNLDEEDIYGETIGAFVSNHYGWASFIYIMSHFYLLQNRRAKIVSVWTLFLIANLGLLIISGSRSSLLSLFIGVLIWLLFKRGNFMFKAMAIFILLILSTTISNPDSALSKRINKTKYQIESTKGVKGDDYLLNSAENVDARIASRSIGVIIFERNPQLYFTGQGIFQFKEAIQKYMPSISVEYFKSGIHNSYLEIYFGCGVLVFIYFIWYFTIKPLSIYYKHLKDSLHMYLGVVIIIPFFESNITGGQFLFFPWFILVFFMLYVGKLYYKKTIKKYGK
ncbi:MAG: hypothetical protein GKR88_06880 [Flavobacteriaceae bacterium]|nr:MAG: hypothetical protein GKR88_06880 [Flavobacteriaceae bacterium]